MRRVLLSFENDVEAWRLPAGAVEALRRDFPDDAFDVASRGEELVAKIAEADVVFSWPPGDAAIGRAGRLRWLHAPAAGVGVYLTPAFLATGAVLTNSRGVHAIQIAEHVAASLLALARDLPATVLEQRSAAGMRRERYWDGDGIPLELCGRTLGVFGYGLIGREVARRAAAFGMKVIALKRRPSLERSWDDALLDAIGLPREEPPVAARYGPGDLHRFLGTCDAVVLSAALTAETEGRFDAAAFAAMKPGAWLVNVARGKLVRQEALIDAIRSRRIAGAALDVFTPEPLPRESELYTLDRVLLTPHISGVSRGFWPRALSLFRENLTRDAGGRPLLNRVDSAAGY